MVAKLRVATEIQLLLEILKLQEVQLVISPGLAGILDILNGGLVFIIQSSMAP